VRVLIRNYISHIDQCCWVWVSGTTLCSGLWRYRCPIAGVVTRGCLPSHRGIHLRCFSLSRFTIITRLICDTSPTFMWNVHEWSHVLSLLGVTQHTCPRVHHRGIYPGVYQSTFRVIRITYRYSEAGLCAAVQWLWLVNNLEATLSLNAITDIAYLSTDRLISCKR